MHRRVAVIRILLSGASAVSIMLAGAPVLAQSMPVVKNYAIPVQSLATALPLWAEQSGVEILFRPETVKGKNSQPLNGRYKPGAALEYLMAGSGLKIRAINDKSYVVEAPGEPLAKAAPASPPLDPADQVEEIVVTAQGREQKLQSVPISATITSGDTLDRNGITNLETLSMRLPNFKIATASQSDFITVRGVGSSLNLGFEQSVGTFVDGIYRGRSRTTRSGLFDLERVELLKGPQTTFFGNNAIAGAINITTRKPGHQLAANGTAFYAPGDGEYTLEAGVSFPVTDKLAFRVAGRQSGMDGYIHNTYLNNNGPHLNDRIARASMAFEPSDIITMNARIDVGRNRDQGVGDYELLQCPAPAVFGAPAGVCGRYLAANHGTVEDSLNRQSADNSSYFNYDFVEGAWNTKIQIGDHTLSFNTGYFHHSYTLNYDPTAVPADEGGSVVGTSQTLASAIGERYNQFSQEVRLSSPTNVKVSYFAGLYYQKSKLTVDQFIGDFFAPLANGIPGLAAGTPVASLVHVTERSDVYSAFAASTVNFRPDLRLNLGLRYTQVNKHDDRTPYLGTSGSIPTNDNFVAFAPSIEAALFGRANTDPGNFATPSRKDHRLLPSASLQYDVNPDVMTYGSYSKGFKAGGYSIGGANASFNPESVDAYEVGVKSRLFDHRLVFNIAGFYSKYKDLQETSTILVAGQSTIHQIVGNVGTTIAKGIEISSTLAVMQGLTLTSDVAYLSSRYGNYTNGPCTTLQAVVSAQCQQDLSGALRAFAPKFNGNVGASYQRPINDKLMAKLDLNLYFTTSFLQQPTSDPRLSQPGNAKLDARLSVARLDGGVEVAIIGKNLTNKLTASYRQVIPSSPGSIAALADPPRSIGVQLNLKY